MYVTLFHVYTAPFTLWAESTASGHRSSCIILTIHALYRGVRGISGPWAAFPCRRLPEIDNILEQTQRPAGRERSFHRTPYGGPVTENCCTSLCVSVSASEGKSQRKPESLPSKGLERLPGYTYKKHLCLCPPSRRNILIIRSSTSHRRTMNATSTAPNTEPGT